MIRKHVNTFEGGVDQDTDKKLVPKNKYFSAKNFTISKDGKIGVLSTFNGFEQVNNGINLNNVGLHRYFFTLLRTIATGETILIYNTGGASSKLSATSDISTLAELKTQIDAAFSVDTTTEIKGTQLIVDVDTASALEFTDFTAIIGTTFDINLDSPISSDDIYTYTDGLTEVTTTGSVSSNGDLELLFDSDFPGNTFNYHSPSTSRVSGSLDFFNFVSFHPNITVTVLENESAVNFETIVLRTEGTISIIGVKEVPLSKEESLLFIWKKDDVGNTYIQVVHLNVRTNTYLNSGYIAKANYSSSRIDEKNIIYEKLASDVHSLYWVNGSEPDKVIKFTVDIDPNSYASWQDYLDVLYNNISDQTSNFFNTLRNDFLPIPSFDSLNLDSGGNLETGESVICVYRLKNGGLYSNLSLFSPEAFVTYYESGITYDSTKVPALYSQIGRTNRFLQYQGVRYPKEYDQKFRIRFRVEGISTEFYNQVEPFFIHYDKGGDTFKVRQGNALPLNSIMELNYNEAYDSTNLPEVAIEELLSLANLNDISAIHTIYRNRRIKFNLTSSSINTLSNFDARAYRFNSSQIALVRDEDTDIPITLDASGGTPDWTDVPEDSDAINSYNDEYSLKGYADDHLDWRNNHQYKYQSDGTTIGGEGPNISYTITNVVRETVTFKDDNWTGTLSPLVLEGTGGNREPYSLKGFAGGEVYRFFITFFKGDTPTSAKWIGDIKFPDQTAINVRVANGANNRGYSSSSYKIDFDIDTSSIKDDITAIAIGYTTRESKDRSVLCTTYNVGLRYDHAAGLTWRGMFMSNTTSGSKGTTTYQVAPTSVVDPSRLNKLMLMPVDLQAYGIIDDFEDEGYYLKPVHWADVRLSELSAVTNSFRVPYIATSIHDNMEDSQLPTALTPITSLVRLEDENNPVARLNLDDTILVYNKTLNAAHDESFPALAEEQPTVQHLPKTLLTLEDNAYEGNVDGDPDQILVSIRRALPYQYGGDNYISRQGNTVELTSLVKINGQDSVTVSPEGDVYSCMSDVRIGNCRSGGATNLISGMLWGIESHVNVHRKDVGIDSNGDILGNFRNFFPNFNAVNTDYEDAQEITRFFKVNPDLKYTTSVPAFVPKYPGSTNSMLVSNKRVEGIDNGEWETFLALNEKILDPDLGDIKGAAVFKDTLIVMQERAIARQFVEQVQQQTDDIADIILGSGEVAGHHEYMLKNIGIQSLDDYIQVDDDVLFRDFISNRLYSITNGEINGIADLLGRDQVNTQPRKMVYDRDTNIVLIPNYEDWSDDSQMIVYDNNLKTITSDKSFEANNNFLYTGLRHIISIDPLIKQINVFGKNSYVRFPSFDDDLDSSITFIVNPEPLVVKIFDTLTIDMEAIDHTSDPVDDPDQSPISIRCKTQYQDTGLVTCDSSNTRRLGRYWRFTIPRDTTNPGNARLRDYYMEVTINFETSSRETKLAAVTTSYRSSNLTRL